MRNFIECLQQSIRKLQLELEFFNSIIGSFQKNTEIPRHEVKIKVEFQCWIL